jgi:Lrp/AsnC family transcriptional regulator for asnA, asnC and gidA
MNNILMKVSLKDRKILYELDYDSRQSLSKIGKKVGLHKNVVLYRIKRLENLGIIGFYYTVIDSFKLGYNSFRVYLVLQNFTPAIRTEIVDYFVKNKYTWWVGTFEGSYDLAIVMWVKDMNDFHIFWEETLKRYRRFFKDQIFCNYVQLQLFRHSFIVDKYAKQDREIHEIISGGRKVKTDDLDFQILEILAKDARIPTIEIAKKINSTVDTVKNRIKRLKKLDVIQGFRVNIDYTKMGYQFYKVNINLNDYRDRGKIIRYIRLDPHLIMIDKSIGYFDLELDFWVRNLKEFHQIMDNITETFPDSIKNYIYVHDPQLHKMRYIPE